MIILGIDPATHCGWSLMDTKHYGILMGGTWDLSKPALPTFCRQKEGREDRTGMALVELFRRLWDLKRIYEFEAIGCEDASLGSQHAGTQAWHNELKGVIRLVATEAGIVHLEFFSPSYLKNFATGNGKATKGEMILAYVRERASQPEDDNHADAYFAMKAMQHQMSLPAEMRISRQAAAARSVRAKRSYQARMRKGK